MPPASITSVMDLLATGQHSPHRVPTSHYDVKCAPGFRCISKVGVFGLGHDGDFGGDAAGGLAPRFQGVYETGCPARGVAEAALGCRDGGSGAGSFCYSTERLEAGPQAPCGDPETCFCARLNSPDGDEVPGHEHTLTIDGEEITRGTHLVLPPAICEDCSQHDCDHSQCDKCEGCEYTSKTLAGRKTTGCFAIDGGASRRKREDSRHGRLYLEGKQGPQRKLTLIPHYPLWDPAGGRAGSRAPGEAQRDPETGTCMPFEGHWEPLSRKAWREEYRRVAPSIQQLLDHIVKAVKELWAKPDGSTSSPTSQHLDCFSLNAKGGDDIAGKIEKVQAIQMACQQMQEVARTIAKGLQFPSRAADGTQVNCVTKVNGGDCRTLNCYSSDMGLAHAMRALRTRNRQCRLVQEYLDEEETRHGPMPRGSSERFEAGRLEVTPSPEHRSGSGIVRRATSAGGRASEAAERGAGDMAAAAATSGGAVPLGTEGALTVRAPQQGTGVLTATALLCLPAVPRCQWARRWRHRSSLWDFLVACAQDCA